jgi:hypothetical protein
MDINTILGLISTFAIVVGLFFAGVQLRQMNKQRVREYASVIGKCKCIKSVNKNVSKFSKINFRFSEQI